VKRAGRSWTRFFERIRALLAELEKQKRNLASPKRFNQNKNAPGSKRQDRGQMWRQVFHALLQNSTNHRD